MPFGKSPSVVTDISLPAIGFFDTESTNFPETVYSASPVILSFSLTFRLKEVSVDNTAVRVAPVPLVLVT
ncbi:MAG TPA: hypothetical protein VD694_05635 [Nitrososphaeraceae archaeon]|nr:hypothetical protein [Nitrososphaeraceae archaeon]